MQSSSFEGYLSIHCLDLQNSIAGNALMLINVPYRISGIFRVGKFWRKWHLEGVLNFHWVIFSLFQGLSMKTYSRVYFCCVYFGEYREIANSAKIKPTRKIPDIRYKGRSIYGVVSVSVCSVLKVCNSHRKAVICTCHRSMPYLPVIS